MLLTRPTEQSRRFAEELGPGATAIISPLLEIVFLPGPVDTGAAAALVFTSSNGVEGWHRRGGGTDLPVWCVGARTAHAAERLGCTVRAHAATLADLAPAIAAGHTGALLHVRGSHVAGDLANLLPQHEVVPRIVYDARPNPLSTEAHEALEAGQIDAIPVFSPRTARRLVAEHRSGWRLAQTRLLAISAPTAAALESIAPGRIETAPRPDGASLLAMLRCNSAQ